MSYGITFNALDWYWLADDGRIFSSARELIVASSDPAYTAWITTNTPSSWPRDDTSNQTNASLQTALTPYNKWVDLYAYAANARYNSASGGVTIGGMPYFSDPISRNTVASAHAYAVANPGHITNWKLADGTFTQLDEPALAHVLQEMATFVQACFTCESDKVTGIGSGSVTTKAQIDAAFGAISNVLP